MSKQFCQLNKRLDKACYILYLEPNPHKWGESFVSKNEFSSLWNFFHRVCIVMARRLSVSNLFCLQNHFSYKDVPHLITSFHQIRKTAFNPHMHKMGLQGPKHYVWWPYLLKKARKLRFHVFLHFNPRKKIWYHHFTKSGPNSQEIVNFYQFSLGHRQLTIGTKFTISFQVKVVTKNIVFGSLMTQRQAALQYDVKFSEPNCYT